MMKKSYASLMVLLLTVMADAQSADTRNEASSSTAARNQAVLQALPFNDDEDFELARRGHIASEDTLIIRDADGNVIWDMQRFSFTEGEAPDTVNPSLWRQAKLNAIHGLFKVTDGIYQVRGYDLSNITLIEGETGYIVVDPILTDDAARAAMQLAFRHLPEKPIVAVIYSHSHPDHFGGVRGIISQADVEAGNVQIVAPEGFLHHTVAENIIAGNIMRRRASYMFGGLLPAHEKGLVDAGLGKAISSAIITLIPPTDIVSETGQEMLIDGVRFVFMNTPLAEAPAELMFYLPDYKAFFSAEEANATMHNLYTLRGAQVRDALLWSNYLHEAANLIPADAEALFGAHHWPRWGYGNIVEYLRKQGDSYRYIHDQTLRLANHGYTMDEIAEQLTLPDALGHVWYNRGYYGTVSHNSRAVYQRYLGFFDGNPAHIQPLPPEDAAKKYVEYMGGAKRLLHNARKAYERGEYRWVAEVVNHLVFADPDNEAARELQASALEQLGYQAESGQWRNFYLSGAQELRHGVDKSSPLSTVREELINAVTLDMFFDIMAVKLNGPNADGKNIVLNFVFEDTGDQYTVDVSNSVLHYSADTVSEDADATLRLRREGLIALALLGKPVEALKAAGTISIEGDQQAAQEFTGLLDSFEFWLNIVTP